MKKNENDIAKCKKENKKLIIIGKKDGQSYYELEIKDNQDDRISTSKTININEKYIFNYWNIL